jgi:hypothetical protein
MWLITFVQSRLLVFYYSFCCYFLTILLHVFSSGSDYIVPSGVTLIESPYWYVYFKYSSRFMSFNMQFTYCCVGNFFLISVHITSYFDLYQNLNAALMMHYRCQWPRGLSRRSAPSACWDCGIESHRRHGCLSCTVFVLPGRGLCDGPIPRPEESYRLWYVLECDQMKITETLDTCCEQVGRRGKD